MIVRLNDPPRVRELTRAGRRTGLVRSHPSWLWRSRRAGDSTDTHPVAWVIFRLGLTILIACGGKFVAEQPLAAQLLTLVGIVFMQARINYLRNQLEDDPSLAVLAQFPVPDWLVFTYQTRQRWRTACWHALDASAFWMVAWTAQYGSIPWMWLPIVAATHAMVIEAMAWALVRVWPMFGLTLFAGGGAIVWIIAQKQQLPSWLWSAAEPMLQALAWLTPWGWLNSTARQLPEQTYLGFVIFALGVFAVCGIVWAFDHVRRIWVLNPIWREFAGRPMQTWDEWDDDHIDEKKPTEPSALTADHHREKSCLVHLGQETSANSSHVARSLAALSRARNTPSGQHLLTLGWAGRHALARCDSDDRWLVDLLAPQGIDTTWWRWALLCAALPAATAIAGQSPLWATGLLTLILLFHRMKWQAIAIGAVTVGTVVGPQYAPVGILLPCVIAVSMSVPVVGGGWNGLPMTITLLGTMPRRWSRMMRIMLIFTGLRLISGIPIMALVIIALYFGIHPTLAVVIGACWITIALSAPWLLALRLIQRTPGGVDLSLGRRLLTAGSASCVMAHMIAIGLLISGCCMMVNADGNGQSDIIMPVIGIGLSIVTSLFHLALLRHAYRRRVDLILSV